MAHKQLLLKRMEQLGYDTITDFHTRSGVPVSLETARAALTPDEQRSVSTPSLMVLMHYLEFTPDAIVETLKKTGDKVYWPMLCSSGERPTRSEMIIVDLFRAIRKDEELWNTVIDMLKRMCKDLPGLKWEEITRLKYKARD